MKQTNVNHSNLSGREVVSSRLFAAPRELVFKAFFEPAHLTKWWGPKGFTNQFYEFNPCPGGVWNFAMLGPDGACYPNESVFLEVVRPERIVLIHLRPAHEFQMTMLFSAENGNTRVTWRMLFTTAEECARVEKFVVEANEQNFDHLGEELEKMQAEEEELVLARM